jgi:hypothetical protein
VAWNVRLPAQWVYQKIPDGCATASVAIALDALGRHLDPNAMTEILDALRASIDTWTGPFGEKGTGNPAGVAGTLNRYAPPHAGGPASKVSSQSEYRVFACPTPYEACATIVNALVKYRSPSIAMIYQGHHWVTVIGAYGEGTPSPGNDYTIEGFWVSNPAVQMTVEQIAYKGWLYEHFTGFAAYPLGQFVVVTDARATAAGRLHLPPPDELPGGLRGPSVDPVARALQGLERNNLMSTISATTAAKYDGIANPVKITQFGVGEGRSDFWLVAFEGPTSEAASWTLVRIDALSGEYLGVALGTNRGYPLTPTFQSFVLSLKDPLTARGYSPEFLSRVNALRSSPDTLRQSLGWQPSNVSSSPYAPFVRADDGQDAIYLTQDGRAFGELSPQ